MHVASSIRLAGGVLGLVAGVVGSASAPSVALAAARAQVCGRACLEHVMDAYLARLVRHDLAGSPIAPDAEIRENTKLVRPGQGDAWTQVVAIKARQDFADPVTGNVVSRTAVQLAGGKIGSMSVRLKVVHGRITEIDSSLNPGAGPFDADTLLEPEILWSAPVPLALRSSRAEMIRIADGYFSGIARHDGAGVPFSRRCDRYESGRKMSNDAANPFGENGAADCAGTFKGLKGQEVEQRRFPLIDEERGVILAYGFIQHTERPKPQATGLAEVFKIVGGKIRLIENIETVPDYPVDGGFHGEGDGHADHAAKPS